ncbi:MAG: hypothetical protein AAF413_00095 [Patescibacteria group bacterium]
MQDNVGESQSVSWVGPEFIHHPKNAGWYMGLGFIAAVVAVACYFLTSGSIFAVITIVLAVIALAAFASRQPKDHQFTIDYSGVYVGERLYPYEQFGSFAITNNDDIESIYLMSVNRLQMPLSLYVPAEQMEAALQIVEAMVPYQERDQTLVEQLMHNLRF